MSETDKKDAELADAHSYATPVPAQPAEPGTRNAHSGRGVDAVRATPEERRVEKAGAEAERSAANGGSAPSGHVAHATHGDAHGAHVSDGHGHGLAHTMSPKMLVGVLALLMVLTIITVLVTRVDLGAQGNLVVAMVIATIKAGLVVSFFMHLVWDKKLHLILFLSSVLFLVLFLALSTADRGEYQESIDLFTATGQP